MQIRTPAVAGMFYPGEKNKLTKLIEDCFLHSFGPGREVLPKKMEKKFLELFVHMQVMCTLDQLHVTLFIQFHQNHQSCS